MKIKPSHNFVLVQPFTPKETTKSGLYLPETSQERPNQGKVIAVGDGLFADDGAPIPVSVKVDDTVLFPKYSGTEVVLDGIKYLLMRDTDIFGVLSD